MQRKSLKNYQVMMSQMVLDDKYLFGMETIIYRQYGQSDLNKIVVFPMIKIGVFEMIIKELLAKEDLYELLYKIEDMKDIEYIRVNKAYTPLDMEITSATHGYETLIYHHYKIDITTNIDTSQLIELVVKAAEESLFLKGFEYIVYIKTNPHNEIKEVYMIVNNISLKGELLKNRILVKDEFLKLLTAKVQKKELS